MVWFSYLLLYYIYYYCLPFSDKHVENKKTNEFRFYSGKLRKLAFSVDFSLQDF